MLDRNATRPSDAVGWPGSQPWAALAVIAFVLHWTWEMAQMPLYSSMHSLARGEAVRRCTAASAGDVVLTLAAFAVVAASARSRRWLLWRRATHIAGYLAVGLAVTIVVEVLAVRSWGRWSYDPRMPRLLGVGLAPLAQWIVVPLATLWVARYYLDGVAHRRAARRV